VLAFSFSMRSELGVVRHLVDRQLRGRNKVVKNGCGYWRGAADVEGCLASSL
jgi:hypothetical protein